MKYRSWQRVPVRGARESYKDRVEWRWYNRWLPPEFRLEGEDVPDEEWWEWRGVQVHLDRLPSPGARAIVILAHGGGGNGRVVMTLGPALRKLGVEVVAPDLPGYGLTERRRGIDPAYDLWADLLADLATREARKRSVPVVIFGLSLGGLLAYAAAARTHSGESMVPVAGVIATTLLDTRDRQSFLAVARSRLVATVSLPLLRVMPRFLRRLSIPIGWVAPMHLITNDPGFSAVFAGDPIAGGSRVSFGFFLSLNQVNVCIEPEYFSGCPVLVAHPTLDPWTPPRLSRAFFDRLSCEKRWVDLEGCGHFPVEQPGRERMLREVASFMDSLL